MKWISSILCLVITALLICGCDDPVEFGVLNRYDHQITVRSIRPDGTSSEFWVEPCQAIMERYTRGDLLVEQLILLYRDKEICRYTIEELRSNGGKGEQLFWIDVAPEGARFVTEDDFIRLEKNCH